MMAYVTDQERIDAATMKIDNPNVVGSGYIQLPPQRPFAGRVLMQPGTVKIEEVPEWFGSDRPSGGPGRGRGHPHIPGMPPSHGGRGGHPHGGRGNRIGGGRGPGTVPSMAPSAPRAGRGGQNGLRHAAVGTRPGAPAAPGTRPPPPMGSATRPAPPMGSATRPAPPVGSATRPAPPMGFAARPAPPVGSAARPAPPVGSATCPAPPVGSAARPAPPVGSATRPAPPTGPRPGTMPNRPPQQQNAPHAARQATPTSLPAPTQPRPAPTPVHPRPVPAPAAIPAEPKVFVLNPGTKLSKAAKTKLRKKIREGKVIMAESH